MAGTFGSINVDIIRGLPQFLKERVETWEVPGIDGYGAQNFGKGDAKFDLVTVTYCQADGVGGTANDAAQEHITNCLTTQGTILTITDDWGDAYEHVVIEHYEAAKQPCLKDGVQQVRVEGHWKCCKAAVNT